MEVRPATDADLGALLALIADYQRFYAGSARDDAHNSAFFGRFIAPSDVGMIIVAFQDGDLVPAGYTCLYWTFSSVSATDIVQLSTSTCAPRRALGLV